MREDDNLPREVEEWLEEDDLTLQQEKTTLRGDTRDDGIQLTGSGNVQYTGIVQEKAYLIGLNLQSGTTGEEETERSLEELAELAEACGAQVLGASYQNRQSVDVATYIGKGKLEEIAEEAESLGCNTLIFDDELSGSQLRNIQELTKFKVLDRTLVILDIFARRATSKEGKLQVELAQYEYRLGRVRLINESMDRLGGGIGSRGPGESQLETDRRHVRERITKLRRTLKSVSKRREDRRNKRNDLGQTTVAVVGYTNAGKSTLINQLTEADLFTMDQVFATLDASLRDLRLPDGSHVMLVDTVGFIRKLPHQLVEAFHSTLEEVSDADMIMHVLDVSDPEREKQVEIVEAELVRLGAAEKPRVLVLNKVDLLEDPDDEKFLHERQVPSHFRVHRVSATEEIGFAELLNSIAEMLAYRQKSYTLDLPYKESTLYAYIKDHGNLLEEDFQGEGMHLKFNLDKRLSGPVERYLRDHS